MKTNLLIEPLESRIAPATLINPTTLIFTDVDGDLVTVKVSKGTFVDPNDFLNGTDDFTFINSGVGQQLRKINFGNDDAGEFSGTNLTITAVRGPLGGDGRVNIGYLDSTGNDLGIVVIDGDLGKLDAGDIAPTPALKSLTVASLGANGTATGAPNSTSTIHGAIGKLTVLGDLREANLVVLPSQLGSAGDIGTLKIGGSLIGGIAGSIRVAGNVGNVAIGRDLAGGSTSSSGSVFVDGSVTGCFTVGGSILGGTSEHTGIVRIGGAVGSVKIGGSLLGGDAESTGRFYVNTAGAVTIRGSLLGTDYETGEFRADGSIKSFTVGGSVIGSSKTNTGNGRLVCGGDLGPVKIGGDLVGTHGNSTGSIFAVGKIKSISIGGSVVGAEYGRSIYSGGSIGAIAIGGDLRGIGDAIATITAKGALNPATDAAALAIKSVKVGGNVTNAILYAGYDQNFTPVNPDAQIGSIVARDWIASSAVAGVLGNADGFGNTNDMSLDGGSKVFSKIGSITIRGTVAGTPAPLDHFGFVAQQIGKVTIAGNALPLAAGPCNDNLNAANSLFRLGSTGDFKVREVQQGT